MSEPLLSLPFLDSETTRFRTAGRTTGARFVFGRFFGTTDDSELLPLPPSSSLPASDELSLSIPGFAAARRGRFPASTGS